MSNFRIYNETLCPDLWDSSQHLDPKIRLSLLQAANDFYEKTELPAPIIDIYLMGSGANYNWTPDSDVDVHVIIDYSKLQMPQETAIKTVKTAGAQWNAEHNILIKGHKVEMNIQNASEKKPYVTGIYSLNTDQWLRKPVKMPFNLDKQVLKFQYDAMKKYVQNCIGSQDREQMKAAKKYLDAYRQYGLDTYGELSYENIIYKMLRARGIIKQLKDSINYVYDRQMTVDEVGYKDIAQSLPTINAIDSPDFGNPNVDRRYSDKMDVSKGFKLDRLTLDELKALREKARRLMAGNNEWKELYQSDFKLYDTEIKRRLGYINASITEGNNHEYNAALDFMERRDRELYDLAILLKKSNGKGKVPWKTISASLLKKTWLLFGKYNKVHTDSIDKIADQILTNIARLDACAGMMGHTPYDVRSELDDIGITFTDKQWDDWMASYFTGKDGGWLISDYGLDPLKKIYGLIFNAETPEEKLYACDKALNVVHQRGDLAAMFVEGGIATLQSVAEQGGYNANRKYGDVNREFWEGISVNESPMMTRQGKQALAGEKPLKKMDVTDVMGNIIVIRQKENGGFIPEGWTLVYFMDSDESAKEMAAGNIPYLMIPRGTFYGGGSPITDVWKNKFQKPGHEHILGLIEGHSDAEKIYINMISVRPGWKRNHIAKLMIDRLKKSFEKAKVSTSTQTGDGQKLFKGLGVNASKDIQNVDEGFGAGIPETDRLKVKNTDGSVRRWQIRSKDAPKTPKMTDEVVIAVPKFDKPQEVNEIADPYRIPGVKNVYQKMDAMSKSGPRANLFSNNAAEEIPPQVQTIISTAERVLDRRAVTRPFFEIEYVEDLIGDIIASEFPMAPQNKSSVLIHEIVRWLARDYDIRQNGKRIGE